MKNTYNVTVSYFYKGELKTESKRVTTTSISMAWRTGLGMVPTNSENQCKIKVNKT